MGANQGSEGFARALRTLTVLCIGAVWAAYAAHSLTLVRYPWDWSPDEGLFLDYARRLIDAPASLYPKQVTPYPASYGPIVAIALAPFVAWSERPLVGARLFNLACVAVIGLATCGLVRRRAGGLAGAAAFALALAPFDLSFWHLLVRADTLMLLTWLLAAWQLMPSRLERSGDRLDAVRLLSGSVFVIASFLCKPTGLIHAAPLAGAWFLVDRGSALRLSGALCLGLLGVVGLLELLTHGGFLWSLRLYGSHTYHPSQVSVILEMFAALAWPVLALAAAAFADSWRRGRSPWRDGSVALLLGGLLAVPGLAKAGAYYNYLLPLLCGLVVAAGRWLGEEAGPAPKREARPLAAALVAIALAATRVFPLPSPRDEATAEFFYAFVRSAAAQEKLPLLALSPDYAYFVVGQPVEMEATGFLPLVLAGAPGIGGILERLKNARYGLVIQGPWGLPESPGVRDLFASYEVVGECRLGTFLGPLPHRLGLRRGSRVEFLPPAGVDCRAVKARAHASTLNPS